MSLSYDDKRVVRDVAQQIAEGQAKSGKTISDGLVQAGNLVAESIMRFAEAIEYAADKYVGELYAARMAKYD